MDGFDLIILDFDGTLFDTRPAIVACLRLTLEYFGHSVDESLIGHVISLGLTLEATFERLVMASNTDLSMYVENYRKIYEAESCESLATIYPGVEQAIKRWFAQGIPLVILSNKGDKAIHSLLQSHDLSVYFSLVIGSNTVGEKKPATHPYDKFISPKFAHIPAKNTLVIGDTAADIEFANNIGASSLWVRYGYGEEQRCMDLKPDQISDHWLSRS